MAFHWNFHWGIIDISTRLTIDPTGIQLKLLLNYNWTWIELKFQLYTQWISNGISLKFQLVFHYNFNWIANGFPLACHWNFNSNDSWIFICNFIVISSKFQISIWISIWISNNLFSNFQLNSKVNSNWISNGFSLVFH